VDLFLKKSLQPNFLFFDPFHNPQKFRLTNDERSKMTKQEIFKLAAFTLGLAPERYVLLRNGKVLLEAM
jgi:hypothetical protein